MTDMRKALEEIVAELKARPDKGEVASYIPKLRNADPVRMGVAIAFIDGRVYAAGDANEPFSLQSISKVFTLSLALGTVGDSLWQRVGREPSSDAFNSIIQLEISRGIPRNPFVNAGSLVVADALLGSHEPRETIDKILGFVKLLADDDSVVVDRRVARSERSKDFRNVALANFLAAFDNLKNTPERVLWVYAHHCAIAMNCRQLALSGRFLANNGGNPKTGRSIIPPESARRTNSLMLMCGQYDGSGEFAFRVGLPAKSGVGGGILAIVPGQAAVAVWSPGLNPSGNSHLGGMALERLASTQGWSIFSGPTAQTRETTDGWRD
jgi:glutaminase